MWRGTTDFLNIGSISPERLAAFGACCSELLVSWARVCEEHDVLRLQIFGSVARGEERPDSDLDLIVDFENPIGFLALLRLERSLAELFGRPVDLVTEPGLSP